MTVTYQVEKYADVIDEIWPMLEAHYNEIATDKQVKPFDPDLDRYQAMEKAGMLRILTVRGVPTPVHDQDYFDGKPAGLIGYYISFVMPGLHYQQTSMAINDIMYIDPAHRGSTVAYRMIKLAISDLKNLGADVLIIHMKCDYPFRSLLTKLGFHLTEENWERVL
jgi:GNAT superfamily N-acetyltransferase